MEILEKLVIKKKDIVIEAVIAAVGKDYLIVVSGGSTPHIGAISFGNQEQEENIALGTHKELEVTKKMFKRLKEVCPNNLLITGGIHIDNITKEQIQQVGEICDVLTERIENLGL